MYRRKSRALERLLGLHIVYANQTPSICHQSIRYLRLSNKSGTGLIVYTGSSTELELGEDLWKVDSVVMTRMKLYFNKEHSLFMNNWYTSSRLFGKIHELKNGSYGTVCKDRLDSVRFNKLTEDDFDMKKALENSKCSTKVRVRCRLQ